MNNLTKRFLRAFGEHEELSIESSDSSISLKFPPKFAYQFADAFDEAYLSDFSPRGAADKTLRLFLDCVGMGAEDVEKPYEDFRNERRAEQAEYIWITFKFEGGWHYEASEALFRLYSFCTKAWED